MTGPLVHNPFLPEFRANPHPFYHRLRSEAPVHWAPLMGGWILTSYAGVMTALRDPRFSSRSTSSGNHIRLVARDSAGRFGPMAEQYARWIIQLDPPNHTRQRVLLARAFTPRVVEGLRPRIQSLIDERLEVVRSAGRMDLIADLANPMPIRVIASLLGVPPEDEDIIKRGAEDLLPMFSGFPSLKAAEQADRAVGELTEYFGGLVRSRKVEPRDDLVSGMAAAQEQDDHLAEEEIVALCIFLALSGHATVVQLIANAVLCLQNRPDVLAALRDRPDLVGGFIEETLRYESPFQLVVRTTLEDVEIHGVTIPTNSLVYGALVAANRDPERFPDPDRFDIHRSDRHVALGHGIHFCAGAALGRLEGQIAVQSVLDRLPGFRVRDAELVREGGLLFRGIRTMPMTFDPW